MKPQQLNIVWCILRHPDNMHIHHSNMNYVQNMSCEYISTWLGANKWCSWIYQNQVAMKINCLCTVLFQDQLEEDHRSFALNLSEVPKM